MVIVADNEFIVTRKAANLLIPVGALESRAHKIDRALANAKACRELWIGGSISIDPQGILFETNQINALVCGAVFQHAILWRDVFDIRYRFGWVSGIIEIIPAVGQTMTFRCFRAKSLASAMRLQLRVVKKTIDAELA